MGIPIRRSSTSLKKLFRGIVVVLGIAAKAHDTEENFIECFDGVQR